MGILDTLLVVFGGFFVIHGITFTAMYLERGRTLSAFTSTLIGTTGVFLVASALHGC